MKALDIGEVVKRSGFRASTLRYYEEKGLITSTGRLGLRRLFNPDVLERLSLIALGREAGFSLEEIASMAAPGGDFSVDRAQLREKAEELDRMIAKLVAIRKALQHAAACPAPRHLDCPKFRRLARIASQRESLRSSRTNSTRRADSKLSGKGFRSVTEKKGRRPLE